jgi:hypothetical protein
MHDLNKAIQLLEQSLWDEAHELVQDGDNKYFFLIHGLLHRIEGDLSNARYWYRRANEEYIENTIDQEILRLKELVTEFLKE